MEVELGTPLADVLDCCGGPLPGRALRAAFSGISNPVLSADQLATPLSHEAMQAVGNGLGATGFVICDDAVCMVEVGEINGDFGQLDAMPVHYLHQSLSPEELVALYCAADVMLVTPYRDGMNLVAKEYVACRIDDTGSLVLSEFAGAARQFTAATLVNPYDNQALKDAVLSCLRAPERDVRRRMRALRRSLSSWTVDDWSQAFLHDMAG